MREPVYVTERKRLERRGLDPIRSQFDTDKTRPNLWLNAACFFVPLLSGKVIFFRSSLDEQSALILFSLLGILTMGAVFTIMRPRRIMAQAFVCTLLSLTVLLVIFLSNTPIDYFRTFLARPFS
jgi:uncharacterized MnhB-related membrane protein